MNIAGFKYICFTDNEVMDSILHSLGKAQTRKNREVLRSLGCELRSTQGVKYITHTIFKPFVLKNVDRFY